jgi:hypothetical protein
MKPQASRCYLCGAPAIRTCNGCGQPICQDQHRLGVNAKGQKQWLCLPCDDRRQEDYAGGRVKR